MRRTRISRRDFMARTAGAAFAANAVMLDPDAYGKSAFSLAVSPPRAVPPSDTIRFGMIGVGMQGSGLMRTSIELPGVECVAACDLYDGRVELAKEIAGKPIFTTKRYKELLDRQDVDCIVAAVPDHWHKQIVVDCCQAGKDVYCEKPMTHHVPEGFEMAAAAKVNNHRADRQPAGELGDLPQGQGALRAGRGGRCLPGRSLLGPQRPLRRVGLHHPARPLARNRGLGNLAWHRAQASL